MNQRGIGLILLAVIGLWGCAGESPDSTKGRLAPLLEGLGDYHFSVTTESPEAQQFFNQGLMLAYAFNHEEAIRSFREAARLDPDCAMCHWGAALALGPNINATMTDKAVPEAYEALQKALQLASKAGGKEQAYIQALAKRYAPEPVEDRSSLDRAYADAMREVAKAYPDDLDAATLFAEAVMDLMPWNYYAEDGQPKPETVEVVTTLESVLARNPDHPGAVHFYIHAVEASSTPERAESYADRLSPVMPGAGHLVHMPSHIYMRVGRYADASETNVRAIASDDAYITQCRAQGIYPLAYHPHNIHFLWASSSMEGRSATAIETARQVASKVHHDKLRDPELNMMQHYLITPLFALTRFGKWDEILKEPPPPEDLLYPAGIWRYARGIAFAAKGQFGEAKAELDKLTVIANDKSMAEMKIWGINSASSILSVASEALAGELAAKRGETKKAISHLEKAVRLQDAMNYNEPPDWHYPVRQSLGAVLLEAGRATEAEKVYREDLKQNPENGWSLFGLVKSLQAQGKAEEAAGVQARFRKAWAKADITLAASRF
jgi:tetratricopeptide (TPR) repeat protein